MVKERKTKYQDKIQKEQEIVEFENNIISLKKTIKNYAGELDVILGNAYLLEGMAYDKLSKRIKAKQSYRKCIELKKAKELASILQIN